MPTKWGWLTAAIVFRQLHDACCLRSESLERTEVELDVFAEDFNRSAFDWSKPSCDVDKLSAEQLSSAVDAKKSGAGNMGGVFFLTLANPGCNMVVKPQLDIHDVYASTLATALDVPVVRTRVLVAPGQGVEASAEWEALVESFAKHGKEEAFKGIVSQGSGFVQLMAVAPGKDLYTETEDSIGWETCDACLTGQMLEAIRGRLPDAASAGLPKAVFTKLSSKKLSMDVRILCERLWTRLSTASADFAEKFPLPTPKAFCSDTWRLSDRLEQDLEDYFAADQRAFIFALSEDLARNLLNAKSATCPDAKKPQHQDVALARAAVRAAFASPSTRLDMARLSAYESFINENDGFSTFGNVLSNYHNVFFSPEHATGIDIAVGGAVGHQAIEPGTPPEKVGSVFNYKEIEQAAKVLTCGSDVDVQILAREKFSKMTRPYANGDAEMVFSKCAREKGAVLPVEETTQYAAQMLRSWKDAMTSILLASDEAISSTSRALEVLDAPRVAAIETWLRWHAGQVKDAFAAGLSSCGGR